MTGPLHEIVAVDDSDDDLLYTRVVLERAHPNARVYAFGKGQDALDWLLQPEGHESDLILLDINMPEMNGFEFLDAYSRLHSAQRARAVVVMLSASPDPDDRARALAFGVVKHYVVKPLDLRQAGQLPEWTDPRG